MSTEVIKDIKVDRAQLYEQVTEQIRNLSEASDNSAWAIGDLLNALVKDAPNKRVVKKVMEEVSKDVSLEYPTLMSYRWVSSVYPKDKRSISPTISYTHYRAAAGTDDPVKWLESASDNGWSVAQLKSQLIDKKESTDIKEGGLSCARPNCKCPLSLESANRVSMYVYGQKLIFCSAACAGNLFINSLTQMKQSIMEETVFPDSPKTIMVTHPNKELAESMPPEDWWTLRSETEKAYFTQKFM
jgi:hypothetical protein